MYFRGARPAQRDGEIINRHTDDGIDVVVPLEDVVSTLDGDQSNGDTGPGQGSFQQLALVVGHHCVSCAVDEQEWRCLRGHITDWAGGRSRVFVLSTDELVLGWHEQLGW